MYTGIQDRRVLNIKSFLFFFFKTHPVQYLDILHQFSTLCHLSQTHSHIFSVFSPPPPKSNTHVETPTPNITSINSYTPYLRGIGQVSPTFSGEKSSRFFLIIRLSSWMGNDPMLSWIYLLLEKCEYFYQCFLFFKVDFNKYRVYSSLWKRCCSQNTLPNKMASAESAENFSSLA